MNLRALIYQNLHEQKSEGENDLKTARLRQLEAESHKDELELKATNSTIDFEYCDLPAPVRLGRDTSNVTVGEDIKPRKRRQQVTRETNEGLLLVDELLTHYEIEYLDELSGIIAWGRVISGGFSSELIKCISDSKRSITLASGEKLSKKDFLEKYRKRFKPEL